MNQNFSDGWYNNLIFGNFCVIWPVYPSSWLICGVFRVWRYLAWSSIQFGVKYMKLLFFKLIVNFHQHLLICSSDGKMKYASKSKTSNLVGNVIDLVECLLYLISTSVWIVVKLDFGGLLCENDVFSKNLIFPLSRKHKIWCGSIVYFCSRDSGWI